MKKTPQLPHVKKRITFENARSFLLSQADWDSFDNAGLKLYCAGTHLTKTTKGYVARLWDKATQRNELKSICGRLHPDAAEVVYNRKRAEAEDDSVIPTNDLGTTTARTLLQAANEWTNNLWERVLASDDPASELKPLADSTYRQYCGVVQSFLDAVDDRSLHPMGRRRPCNHLRACDFVAFKDSRKVYTDSRGEHAYSLGTKVIDTRCINSFCSWMMRQGYVKAGEVVKGDRWKAVSKDRLEAARRKKQKRFFAEESRKLIAQSERQSQQPRSLLTNLIEDVLREAGAPLVSEQICERLVTGGYQTKCARGLRYEAIQLMSAVKSRFQRVAYKTYQLNPLLTRDQAFWISVLGLGQFLAYTSADIGNLTTDPGVIDWESRSVCFDRVKTKGGTFRRGVLPARIAHAMEVWLNVYRPKITPAKEEYANRVFLTSGGLPLWYYKRDLATGHTVGVDNLNDDWRRFAERAGVAKLPGRGFSGLRTTFQNDAHTDPESDGDIINIVFGHKANSLEGNSGKISDTARRWYLETYPPEKLSRVADYLEGFYTRPNEPTAVTPMRLPLRAG